MSFKSVRITPVLLALVLASGCTCIKRWAYGGASRDEWQQPDRVIQALGLSEGDRVADLGAGGGYFSFRLANAVGPTGRVYAVDVDAGMIDYLSRRADEEGRQNFEAILAAPDDARLPEGSVDLIFSSNTFHHLENRIHYFARIRPALRAGGRIAIVEFRAESASWFGRGHSSSADAIRNELAQAGFRLEQEHDFLPRQHFMVFSVVRR